MGFTVAILAQGTEWAVAITQAFLRGFNSQWVHSPETMSKKIKNGGSSPRARPSRHTHLNRIKGAGRKFSADTCIDLKPKKVVFRDGGASGDEQNAILDKEKKKKKKRKKKVGGGHPAPLYRPGGGHLAPIDRPGAGRPAPSDRLKVKNGSVELVAARATIAAHPPSLQFAPVLRSRFATRATSFG